ncbi:hypothetical protein A2331_04000 [Candidatus Falkowbacteria bacterium RIFOXYB2_FULL_34_18]|uniref:Uncharacterized protein n=1 Tax=Candidatus Falkowbacteria bacterium RIFOXYD2_FULL_34_120 TaxID=1798007 RepID=A0A1F5TPP7_9BACT|nr:MAG: hypothetical protein A2331_04000 [Candidatus Falkowbacteria bacterium RIFOXYB2_FULL_34_18]OGF29114.1 MAG: hypothetical protein A2500_03325 [Candidatus Falkowbacteria bacterium RIFOXYC12_FULL_34_55]OGF36197.1 MAG: hypothetical protein A2466_04855 [Candidatus Falkowbacteria bacterium RIFOXYC2_FULL_34_220]OGF38624.1 MAG: hypothetical protein A2515_02215 [Candidatus Falkowbacteria bacterium RIFOXYD12_FULL_34_57]OGF40807.1 MAG: hypothetical protein A2531_06860 [Candidatus Falkowbacteria bact
MEKKKAAGVKKKTGLDQQDKKILKALSHEVSLWKDFRQSYEENKEQFSGITSWAQVKIEAKKHPSWFCHFKISSDKEEIDTRRFVEEFVEFLTKARTVNEIKEKFKISPKETEELLKCSPPKYRFGVQKTEVGEDSFMLLPEVSSIIKEKEKIWQFKKHESYPYIVISFPDNNWKKINIVPISDVFFGHAQHDGGMFDEYVNWISRTPHVFCFLNGNIFKKFVKAEEVNLNLAITELQNKLGRIAHKILWAQPGTNEEFMQKFNIDPLQFVCGEYNIPYFQEPVYVDVMWKKHVFTFYCLHGRSNAHTKGGKINAVSRSASFQEFVMFTVMGHIKDKVVNPIIKIERDPIGFELKDKMQYMVICPGFLKYFGSEEAKKGYKPHTLGTVSCRLYANGTYRTSN